MDDLSLCSIGSADLANVADLHLAAFPTSLITALGHEAARRYYRWLLEGPHDAAFLGARRGATLVGFCCAGTYRGALGGFLLGNLAFLARHLLTHPQLARSSSFRARLPLAIRALVRSVGTARGGSPGTTPPDFGILVIATHPDVHGRGVGTLLLDRAEALARQGGFREMSLTVHPGNGRAVRFYARRGWQKSPERGAWHGRMRKRVESRRGDADRPEPAIA